MKPKITATKIGVVVLITGLLFTVIGFLFPFILSAYVLFVHPPGPASTSGAFNAQYTLEESLTIKPTQVEPGSIGYEFQFTKPLVILSNFVVGANKGYGPGVPIVNNLSYEIADEMTERMAHNYPEGFVDNQPMSAALALEKKFLIINVVSAKGPGGHSIYILKDDQGNLYFANPRIMPWMKVK